MATQDASQIFVTVATMLKESDSANVLNEVLLQDYTSLSANLCRRRMQRQEQLQREQREQPPDEAMIDVGGHSRGRGRRRRRPVRQSAAHVVAHVAEDVQPPRHVARAPYFAAAKSRARPRGQSLRTAAVSA